tara:strand:+ start:1294 stop:1794 length:501 start_codon:yes stop_codon:yes gene_type:complete
MTQLVRKLIIFSIIISLSVPTYALKLTDVKRSDPGFNAIKYSISKGYLPVYSNNTFKPDQEISRRELALTIDTLIKQINQRKISLTETEIQELNHLSKSFKTNYSDFDFRLNQLELNTQNMSKSQVQIQEEITRSHYKLKKNISFLQKQNIVLSFLLVLSFYFARQ